LINRRQFVAAAAAVPLSSSMAGVADEPIYIGDMHFHLFFIGPKPAASQPLARNMASGGATLVSWSLVGDVPWLQVAPGGFKPKGAPKPGEAIAWFRQEMDRVQGHIAGQRLKIARTPDDIAEALAGSPHVVLSIEGASFLDDDISHLRFAHERGVRHIQLVHFIRNRIGDVQTERAEFDGLTDFGRQVIVECNRLGILVDLAHCTETAVQAALAVSKVPMVWSHSSVLPALSGYWPFSRQGWQARQLTLGTAKAIAGRGGVVGLWAMGADVGTTVESYAERIAELADRLGTDHVAFGTDMNALAKPAVSTYADLRRVVTALERRGLQRTQLRQIAIENYARVLRTAMRATG
jgi:membrane dipeptidase